MRPKITVLIPTFNRAEYLAECLDSILAQTCPAAQIIVVNDGGSDETPEVIKPYSDAIDYYETPNIGKPGALNYGLKKTQGDYLWIFDDDDVAFPDALERFVEPLERHDQFDFSYSPFFYTKSNPSTGRIGSVLRESHIPNFESTGFLIPLLEGNFLGGAALFARTLCYEKVDGFDPILVRSQDYEMAIRIARRFKGVRVSGGATFHYRQHEGLRGSWLDRFEAKQRGDKWLYYDSIFFRRLYRELPLKEYLPPGLSLENNIRQALLQRMGIMMRRLLVSEAIEDLKYLTEIADQGLLAKQEKLIIWNMMNEIPCASTKHKLEKAKFLKSIHRLADSSPIMKFIREEIFKETLWRFKINPSVLQMKRVGRRVANLYVSKRENSLADGLPLQK